MGDSEYRASIRGRGQRVVYAGPSLVTAAKLARQEAKRGRQVLLTGPEEFRTRLYRPEFAHRSRWWYSLFCPKCNREMDADVRILTCRKCWNPRNSQAHMDAVAAMNERKRQRRS